MVKLFRAGVSVLVMAAGLICASELHAEPQTLKAWGYNALKQTNVPPGLSNIVAITAGGQESLALRSDGSLVAWGDNAYGQTNPPVGLNQPVSIVAGNGLYLALQADSTLLGWGNTNYAVTPPPAGLSNVVAISANEDHAIALKRDGTIVVWGKPAGTYGDFGQAKSPAGLSNVVAIAAGAVHNLALKSDGTLFAWGFSQFGATSVPPGLSNVVAIAAGYEHSLALKDDGTVVAWGNTSNGQTNALRGLSNVVAIAEGASHSLVLTSDGKVIVWGGNGQGQTNMPSGLSNVVAIATGVAHSMVLMNDGSPYIMNHPLSRLVSDGTDMAFRVTATGALPLSYQWQCNGTNIPDATSASLKISNVAVENQGSYSVVISNSHGSVTSRSATLTVSPLPLQFRKGMQNLQLTSDGFKMHVAGSTGTGPVVIYGSTNLVDWEAVFTNSPTTGTVQFLDSTATNGGLRFYRAEQR